MKQAQYPQQIIQSPLGIFTLKQESLSRNLMKIKSHDEIKIVYFGTPEFSAYILGKLIEFCQNPPQISHLSVRSHNEMVTKFTVQAVVTNPAKTVGRKQLRTLSPVALVAKKYNIPIIESDKLDDVFLKSHLSFLTADLFIVVSYGQILPKILLDTPKLGAINLHGSLLPKYRGASPIQQVILNGDKETGITIIQMDQQLDHGPILSAKQISISEKDNYETLSKKMMRVGAAFLLENLPKFIEGKIKLHGQNHAMASYCPKLTRDSGYFDIEHPPEPLVFDRMIRAYYPWPGVWTRWSPSRHPEGAKRPKDLKIIKFLPDGLIQMEGKKPLSLKDFLNGYPDFPLKLDL